MPLIMFNDVFKDKSASAHDDMVIIIMRQLRSESTKLEARSQYLKLLKITQSFKFANFISRRLELTLTYP